MYLKLSEEKKFEETLNRIYEVGRSTNWGNTTLPTGM
jgi:hypothetical protein